MRRLDGGQQEDPWRSAFLFGLGIGVVFGVVEGIQFGAGRGLLVGVTTGLLAAGMRLLIPKAKAAQFLSKNPILVAFLLVLPFAAVVAAALLL